MLGEKFEPVSFITNAKTKHFHRNQFSITTDKPHAITIIEPRSIKPKRTIRVAKKLVQRTYFVEKLALDRSGCQQTELNTRGRLGCIGHQSGECTPRCERVLDTLDEAAFGAASEVQPKFTSHSDPASQWMAARKGPTFFSYSDNYLIDTDHGVIVDVQATRSIRQAEVGSTKTMLKRVKERFDLHPERLIADTAYGTGPLLGWLVDRKIAPHIPVFDKAGRSDGTWSRADFEWDAENDQYICREGHELKQFRRNYSDRNRGPTGKGTARYRALKEI